MKVNKDTITTLIYQYQSTPYQTEYFAAITLNSSNLKPWEKTVYSILVNNYLNVLRLEIKAIKKGDNCILELKTLLDFIDETNEYTIATVIQRQKRTLLTYVLQLTEDKMTDFLNKFKTILKTYLIEDLNDYTF